MKHFHAWQHLVIMLDAVIRRFDSLREITDSMFPEARKLAHLGIRLMPRRSTLSDANARRPEAIFEAAHRHLYATYRGELSADSRKRQTPKWLGRLQIIDSTTISLFSDLLFKGAGCHPKTGKKKGGLKVHTNIHANEGVPSDVRFTSTATNDSFMLKPSNYEDGDILAIDRAYIDYAKFAELTRRGVIYVTKMKKNLVYDIEKDEMMMAPGGLMAYTRYSMWSSRRRSEAERASCTVRASSHTRTSRSPVRASSASSPTTWTWMRRKLWPSTARGGRSSCSSSS